MLKWQGDSKSWVVWMWGKIHKAPQGKSYSSKGGLIIYLNENYDYKTKQNCNQSRIWEGQFINIIGGGLSKSITLGNVYRPPRDTNENYRLFVQKLTPVLSNFSNTNNDIIIAGDTNINLLKINEREFYSEFFDMLTSHSFYLKITLPTRFSNTRGTLIDNFFCKLNDTTINSTAGILIKKFSDHQPYFINTVHPIKYVKIKQQNQSNIEKLLTEITNSNLIDNIDTSLTANPNDNYNVLHKTVGQAMEKHIPDKTEI